MRGSFLSAENVPILDSLPFLMPHLRILSINLLVDRADPSALRKMIREADPDVVCTQEMGPVTAGVVTGILPHGHLDPREDLFGMGIATTYPVTVESLGLEARSGWVARLDPRDWPDLTQPLDVFNVHLTNPVDFPWRASRDERRGQIAQIATVVGQRDCAGVVIGDMNASPSWPEYKLLSEIGCDAARVTGTERRTWSHFLSGPRLLRIDHAFMIGVRPITTSVARVRGTDHRALIVDIEV
jgi:endonuclease/exonuclease/phosphatase (EEP) superfamily protein YafD